MEIKKVHMGPAKCAVDLGDGSERGEYVNQDEILQKLGRPHRSISLMYCYYPHDDGFPGRASVVHANPDVKFAWGYPYDDYFTYKGGISGTTDDEPFTCMRDIRAHGQDVTLTITMDPKLSDEYLAAIGKDLSTFGRVFLRINHEATGNWFSFNKRGSYQEVADFFVRASKIIRENAPNVQTIICIDGAESPDATEIKYEKEFAAAVIEADIWSVDKYMALHWGWPYDIAEPGGNSHKRLKVRDIYEETKRSFELYKKINGGIAKPMIMSEHDADGDVTGPFEQADMVREYAEILESENADWFSAFTFYQFRDRGRLGLEIEDPNNPNVGIPQPVMATYKELIHSERFMPKIEVSDKLELPVTLRWGNSEDADGLAIPLHFEKQPHFCEAIFDDDDDSNYIMELGGKWFYKSPKAKLIDFMPAFFEKPLTAETDLTLKIFAPPATGENNPAQGDDWQSNFYTEVKKLPKIRILFNPVL
ncbi:MAG: hypothetical protein LBM87_06060 [Ruminococcus sp.]|jgi:hypothetical protein|nr:hypothetical protein [Ruminococcus sp.]